MKITEQDIDHLIEKMDTSSRGINQFWSGVEASFPGLAHFILNADKKILTESEYGQMVFAAMVIVGAFMETDLAVNEEDLAEMIAQIEDQNWGVMDKQRGDFSAKLNVFFDNYQEEDLLAFVEDMLVDDETTDITPVGREVIFIKLKTVIDFLFVSA